MFESYLLNLKETEPVIAMLATLVCVLIIGTSAQIFSERLRIPATRPLLVVGLLFGPEIIGLVPPNGETILKYDDILTILGDSKSLERAKRILQVAD